MLTDIKLATQQSCGVLPLDRAVVGKCACKYARLARCSQK